MNTRKFLFLGMLLSAFSTVSFSKTGGVTRDTVLHCDSVPPLNLQILEFVKTKMNKKVGKGECWDLAAESLNKVGAKWNGGLIFGKEVFIGKDCIYPGDIMQFEGVRLKYIDKGEDVTETMAHHTAIIFEVKGDGVYTIVDQNTDRHGRKVGLGSLDLKNIVKGKYKIYQPVK